MLPMEVKVLVSFVPTVVTAVTMTTAIRPAIRPYSMAVAPESSLAKREKMENMATNLAELICGYSIYSVPILSLENLN